MKKIFLVILSIILMTPLFESDEIYPKKYFNKKG